MQLQSASYYGQTFLHLGIVWGLRTLSPLWRDVWRTKSVSGDELPRTPCLRGGTTQGCSRFVEKAIVIVSDGANDFGDSKRGRSHGFYPMGASVTTNPNYNVSNCRRPAHRVYQAEDPATFGASFGVGANGVFSASALAAVLDGLQALHPILAGLDPMANPADQVFVDRYRTRWEHALIGMTPWQLFRGHDDNSPSKGTDAIDVLVDPTNDFGLVGRPVQNGHFCRPESPFSAYGRADELVSVGDAPPVADVAPFSVPDWLWSSPTVDLTDPLTQRLDDWFREACDIAGRRGVRIHAIYIGGDTRPWEQRAIALLEECVDRGYGGNPLRDEVHAAPTARELKDAIEDIMDIKRTLRFVGP